MKLQLHFTALLLACSTVQAQSPHLLKDINTTTQSTFLNGGIAATATHFYFTANPQDGHGAELWKSDGTGQGTLLVKDLLPGIDGANPEQITAVGDQVFFVAKNDLFINNAVLHVSDGTIAGTVMVGNGIFADQLTAHDNFLYYFVNGPLNSPQVWRTDGVNIELVAETIDHTYPKSSLFFLDNIAFFITENSNYTTQLWRTDGTPPGTWPLAEVDAHLGINNPVTAGGRIFFWVKTPADGYTLWASDGTISGTQQVKDFEPGGADLYSGQYAVSEGQLYLVKQSTSGENEFWRTDGTTSGTTLLDSAPLGITQIIAGDGKIFAAGYDLYVSDGNGLFEPIPTVPATLDFISKLVYHEGKLYFTASEPEHGFEPWVYDPDTGIPALLKDLSPGYPGSSPVPSGTLGQRLIWKANTTLYGEEYWFYDPVSAIFELVADLNTRTNSSTTLEIKGIGSNLYVAADNGLNGLEMWRGELPNGELTMYDMLPGPSSGFGHHFTEVSNNIIFTANTADYGVEPWRWNSSTDLPALLKDLVPGAGFSSPANYHICNEKAFFVAMQYSSSNLFVTDGTTAGTVLLNNTLNYGLKNFTCFNQEMYFTANNAIIYKSDGTPAGTVVLKQFDPSQGTGLVSDLMPFKDMLYFSAPAMEYGQEIWRTDGTPENTSLFADLITGAESAFPAFLTTVGDKLFFTAFNDGANTHLWVSDGTITGTAPIGIISTPDNLMEIITMVATGNRLFWVQNTLIWGLNPSVWSSDGTISGTKMVTGENLVRANGPLYGSENYLFFLGNSVENGTELWALDVESDSVYLVADICEGTCHGMPELFTVIDGVLYFTAYQDQTGREPWYLQVGPVSTQSPNTYEKTRITILQNPVSAGLVQIILHGALSAGAVFTLSDISGQILWHSSGDFRADSTVITLPVPSLPAGMYFVNATGNGWQSTTKLMVIPR